MPEIAVSMRGILVHDLFKYCGNNIINLVDYSGYAAMTISANGSFEAKYERQITNSRLYQKNKGLFFFKNKKNVNRWISKKFNGGFYYSYGYYNSGSLFSQKGYRFTTYYFLTKKVSEWRKSIKTYDFSWMIKVMQAASFLMQAYSGSGYTNNGDAWMLLGESIDRALEGCGDMFSSNLRGVVIDSMSQYISDKIYGKKANEKVSILMFAKTSCCLKKIFSKKWESNDSFYGYPWERKHYFIR